MKKAIIIVAVIAGILLILQIRSFKKVDMLFERSEQKVVLAELRTFQVANQQLREHLEEAETALADTRSRLAQQTIDEEIDRLKLLSGEVAVKGEGVELTLNIPVEAFWISDLIAQLVTSGAEAIAVNDVRLTSATAGFRLVGNGLLMRRRFLRSPIRIAAIGPSSELQKAVAINGGILDRIKKSYKNLTVMLVQRENIVIPALAKE